MAKLLKRGFAARGSFNTVLGTDAGLSVTAASKVIVIGSAEAEADDSCYIGNIWN